MKSVQVAMIAASLFLTSGVASAEQSCKPLTRLASVDLVPGSGVRQLFVPVQINNTPKLLLLDTGGSLTRLSNTTADELKLERRQGDFELYNISGKSTSEFATASLRIGRLVADKVAFVIGKDSFSDDPRVGGLLAADILSHYDVAIDFANAKLELFSQDHCEGQVIYWPASAVAVVPIRKLKSGHIMLPVALDGHVVNALVDTGATTSTLDRLSAEGEYGLTLGTPETPEIGELDSRPGVKMHRHRFSKLEFSGITVSNPDVLLIPNMLGQKLANAPSTGSRLADRSLDETSYQMLVGMNVLKHLHLFISYREQKLYITPASPPAPAAK